MGAESGLAPLLRTERPLEDDRQLLEGARSGDRAAAERWVEQTYRTVFAWAYRLSGDRDLAADLTQETFRRAWQALPSFDARCRTTTWLCRIAYNAFLNHRRRPLRVVALDEARDLADTSAGAEADLQEREGYARLRAAVLELPEDLCFSVTARFWGDLSVAEIAAAEGVTSVAIRKRLKRALTALLAALEGGAS